MASEVFDLVVRGKAKLVGAAVQAALDAGTDPNALLADMIGAMDDLRSRDAGFRPRHEEGR